jgi:hypothetical protein
VHTSCTSSAPHYHLTSLVRPCMCLRVSVGAHQDILASRESATAPRLSAFGRSPLGQTASLVCWLSVRAPRLSVPLHPQCGMPPHPRSGQPTPCTGVPHVLPAPAAGAVPPCGPVPPPQPRRAGLPVRGGRGVRPHGRRWVLARPSGSAHTCWLRIDRAIPFSLTGLMHAQASTGRSATGPWDSRTGSVSAGRGMHVCLRASPPVGA